MGHRDSVTLQIDGVACVRPRLLLASCDACQTVCPVDAIDLSRGAPVVDLATCTDCGACGAACLEGVFPAPAPLPVAQDQAVFKPCTDVLGLKELSQLWLEGVRRILVALTHCDTCKTASIAPVDIVVADFNRLIESRALPEIELVIASKQDLQGWQKARMQGEAPDPSRRAFLRRFVAPPPEETHTDDDPLLTFLAQGQTGDPDQTLYPFFPDINPEKCIGCDDCIRICPHDALTLIKAENGKSLYHCAPEHCTGCRLCSDVCDVEAIKVNEMDLRGADILLTRFQCRACGVETHVTDAQPPDDGLCRVCHQTNHRKNLFVVLD